jgi:CheY-like chemotaxis protein
MAKVLVADDEVDIVETIRLILEARGHEVLKANDGMEALEQARNHKPDIIFLDVMMPKLDGYRACRMLKFDSQFQNIPVVLLTARAGSKDISTGGEVGADEYITKPFDVNDVLELVDRLVENSNAEGDEVE